MDRDAVVRAGRRRQVIEALEFERARAAALRERLEVVVTELDGPGVDEALFAAMTPQEVDVVRPELQAFDPHLAPEGERDAQSPADEPAPPSTAELQESEIERLQGEIEASLDRQRAFERYLELLGN